MRKVPSEADQASICVITKIDPSSILIIYIIKNYIVRSVFFINPAISRSTADNNNSVYITNRLGIGQDSFVMI